MQRHISTLAVLFAFLLCPATFAQVMNSKDAAGLNTTWLTKSLATGKPVILPVGTLYISGTVTTKPIVGCGRLESMGAGGYAIDGHPTLGGFQSRIVQLGKGPILRLSGAGFIATDPLEFVGDGESAAIEIEGRATPATGRHRFRNLVFRDWGCAFKCLGGYYKDGQFVADENHGDNTIVEGCETFNVGTLFRSENQQSVNWVFRDCVVNGVGLSKGCIVADIERGGCLTLDRLVIEDSRTTIFRLKDFSPNNCRLVCRDFYYDRMGDDGQYLRLVDYVGDSAAAAWSKWSIHINGFSAAQKTGLDEAKFYQVPKNLPRDDWQVDVARVGRQPAASASNSP